MNRKQKENEKKYKICPTCIFGLGKIHHLPISYQRQKLLNQAIEVGFKDFDVSPAYGNGLNEIELGKFIRKINIRPRILTKFGIPIELYGATYQDFSYFIRIYKKLITKNYGNEYLKRDFTPSNMKNSLEGSLRRLKVDYVDDFMIHEPIYLLEEKEKEAILEMAYKLIEEKKILRFGVSGGFKDVKQFLDYDLITSLMCRDESFSPENSKNKKIIFYNLYKNYIKNKYNEKLEFSEYANEKLKKGHSIVLSSINIKTIKGFTKILN